MAIVGLVVIAVAAYLLYGLVAGIMKLVVVVAAVAAAVWVLSRLRRPAKQQ